MECAGRALSFWAYQTTQEIVYQRYLEKTLTEKLKSVDMKLQKAVDDANTEIASLQERIQGKSASKTAPLPSSMLADILAALSEDYDDVRRKHEELAYAYQHKCRKLTQVQELYDRVKRKAELGQMEAAAVDAVDSSLQHVTQAPDSNISEPAASRQSLRTTALIALSDRT
ncbi:uncharacterized protein ColSpa_05694 [Colletotrichum spaethianum]|uniref:Uncharacterized protein n=1 Tax=Colletotrichum spaethianum TaxID=700344 RepID=A0AA37LFH2_9PEZI|nr:uncharacterized protein ColSpa_05694 [Colletotrichum spaethianum]GKT45513.1 hypothetical protein ColSpa_05694 [Colletotrichum spaethianum]